jgi:hypothetical protein
MSNFLMFMGGMVLGFIAGWKISDGWYDMRHFKKNWKESDL